MPQPEPPIESLGKGGIEARRSRWKRFAPRVLLTSRLRNDAGNRVLLTFDDGPDPAVTPLVLDRLDAFGAKAMFFVIGRKVRRAPDIVREALRRGHLLGNHSHLHRDAYVLGGAGLTLSEYYHDCRRCQSVVERCLGVKPKFFRPPGGRLSPTTVMVPLGLGLRTVGWSIEVADWRFRTEHEARHAGAALAAAVQPRDIVLLHDGNAPVVALLDELLPLLSARGIDLADATRFV